MVDITTIPTSKLESDLLDSQNDIKVCELALLHDVTSYSHGSVNDRLEKNKYFVKVITTELERRRTMRALDPPSALVCSCGSVAGVHCDWCPCANTAGK